MAKVEIIEDDDQMRALLATFLSQAGYRVVVANDGERGVRVAGEDNPDVVLVDIFMPRMDGIEVINKLRELRPKIPIIAISGGVIGTSDKLLGMARKLGADEVLAKPFPLDALLESIARVVPHTNSPPIPATTVA